MSYPTLSFGRICCTKFQNLCLYVTGSLQIGTHLSTVKTLYNVTRYNRIFNIRLKIAGKGSISIKIPSL